MIKNNVYYEFFASYMVPNSNEVGYWIDLGANSKGKVIKVYNPDIKSWVKLTDALKDLNGFQNCTYAFANSPSFQEIAINLKLTTPNNEDLFPHVLSFGEAAILQRFGDDLNTAIVEVGRKGYSPFWTSTRVNNEEFWWIESIDFVNANTSEGILQAMVHYTTSQEDTLYFLPIFDLSNQ